MKRIYLIDCPGVVPPSNGDSEEDILLRGVVRVENVEHPAQYIEAVLRRTQMKHIERTYDIKASEFNNDPIEFLSILARKGGRLLKGGEADVDGVAKMVLNDFLRGKIPWFTPPPKRKAAEMGVQELEKGIEGREGRLGEMPGKRKREDEDENAAEELEGDTELVGRDSTSEDSVGEHSAGEKGAEDEFESFSSEGESEGESEEGGVATA